MLEWTWASAEEATAVAVAAAAAVIATLEPTAAAATPMVLRGGPGAAQPRCLDLEGAVAQPGSLATCELAGKEVGAAAAGDDPTAH